MSLCPPTSQPAIVENPLKAAHRNIPLPELIRHAENTEQSIFFFAWFYNFNKITTVVLEPAVFCRSRTAVHKLFNMMCYISLSCSVWVCELFLINFWQHWKPVTGRAAVKAAPRKIQHIGEFVFLWTTIDRELNDMDIIPRSKGEFSAPMTVTKLWRQQSTWQKCSHLQSSGQQ